MSLHTVSKVDRKPYPSYYAKKKYMTKIGTFYRCKGRVGDFVNTLNNTSALMATFLLNIMYIIRHSAPCVNRLIFSKFALYPSSFYSPSNIYKFSLYVLMLVCHV